MRAVVQRVTSSSVQVDGNIVGSIGRGLNVLIGISKSDTLQDLKYIRDKVINLRIFEDEKDKMNLSILDVKGELLVISQFTLYGDCRKGRRPNFMEAKGGEEAEGLYKEFLSLLKESNIKIETGEFGADMKVEINNDGPVTIILDSSKNF
ncbi:MULTISPECIES: D-aminoacyl-tRNA deacylase [Clostridium]|uniref:D-aminoacyl-tRNA deacylase n=1 Tax=Clostridium botulinum (strain Eklund 17B / Type B) TaxID=935198 RepID=DTD_CLOBB|nr:MULTISPECIES: D-aminoacyl-tRNA deacylase [Clostridium]B2TN01.1 RecName: Full=D-aminoacyl-tRNA deacylase; Short=DTD; AltName: Full=Gly-tRNA(Ala) deacylase [Clostridium botulinum B str. Eklund 17B (NRP)]MBN1044662.1 D-tyrosyl-tRNA(Tyr) deacylase [Clostridium botulinum]ACD22762.1 D-tyrosyl-tRNA(Tyr) deacylase [Clostridium botulinum B str. Eklund 17B (NRP)]MBN1051392.1 D-tyrosyl-tRNA(Tyr) deacylase [Clostridium botulinum]MBN1054620.1 D-tyrosyl-tRNA(Tyr) deacylase [Clostridium botulinum]MBY6975